MSDAENPYSLVEDINRRLRSEDPNDIRDALNAIDAYFQSYPNGRPHLALEAALAHAVALDGSSLERLVRRCLDRRGLGEARETVVEVWRACEGVGPAALTWLIDELVERCLRQVEPGHLEEEHPLLALLVSHQPDALGRVLVRALDAGHFDSFGILLAPYLRRRPPPEEEAQVLVLVKRAYALGQGMGYVTRCRAEASALSRQAAALLAQLTNS